MVRYPSGKGILRSCYTGRFVKGEKGGFFPAVSFTLVLRMARRTKPVVTIFFKVDEAFVRIMAERTKRTRFFHAVRHEKPYQIIIPAPYLGEAEKIFKAGDAQMQMVYFIKKREIACLQAAQSFLGFFRPVAVEKMSEFRKSGIGYHGQYLMLPAGMGRQKRGRKSPHS